VTAAETGVVAAAETGVVTAAETAVETVASEETVASVETVATGIGSMPGEDFAESTRTILGEVGDLPFLAELPARGVHAAMTGRTLALVTDLGIDLQPAGWRLTDASGIDHRRAASLLTQDLDTFEELAQAHRGTVKVQIAGPWTLAATVERPRGDRVLADPGARRDLAQALAEGVARHAEDVRRRISGADQVIVQVDEPALPAVLTGTIPTASGFSRHRSVAPPEAAQALDWVLDAVRDAGAETVVHCCAADLPLGLLEQTSTQSVSFDLAAVASSRLDDLARWVDAGRQVWLGVVPTLDPTRPPTAPDLTRRVLSWWSDVGFGDVEGLPEFAVTPACGLATASPAWARTALGLAANVARNVSVEQGKIEP
jgi:methionine synthase II (cobalamin-independent)